jgi:hypothetical protein
MTPLSRFNRAASFGLAARLSILVFCLPALYGAGTLAQRMDQLGFSVNHAITITATADAADGSYPATGNQAILRRYSSTPVGDLGGNLGNTDGYSIISVETIPGSPNPTVNWDLALLDVAGADILGAGCINRSANTAQLCYPANPHPLFGNVLITITGNSVNSAAIVIKVTLVKDTVAKRGGAAGGAGTVTSVDLSVPPALSVSGSPIIGAGTLAVTETSGYANYRGTAAARAGQPCTVGDKFFTTDAAAGSNWYGCTAANTWTVQGGSGGAGTVTSITSTDACLNVVNGTTAAQLTANTAICPTQATVQAGSAVFCAGAGSAGAQTCGATPALTAYTSGMVLNYKPGNTNTTTQTVNVDALGAKSVLSCAGGALSGGDVAAAQTYILAYDGTAFRLPCAGSAGGGPNMTTTGAGFICLPSCAVDSTTGAVSSAPSSKVPRYQQFVATGSFKFTGLAGYVQTAVGSCGATCGFAAAIYDISCNKVSGTDLTTSTALTAAGAFYLTATAATTIPAGVYYLGWSTDGTALAWYGALDNTVYQSIFNAQTGNARFFTGATSATGANGTLAMPASCGARTAITASYIESFLLFP